MNVIQITQDFNHKISQIKLAGKTPWFIIREDLHQAVDVFAGRTQAREAKADFELAGKIVKYDEVKFEIIKPTLSTQVPKTEKVASKKIEIVHQSTIERPCKMVFQIADEMLATRPNAKRKDILAVCVEYGIAYYTARTQYQSWLQVRKEMTEREIAQLISK